MQELDFTCTLSELAGTIRAWDETTASNQVTFGVSIEDVLFPVFVSIDRDRNARLTVLYNGAVSRERSKSGIVFQRASWKDDLPSTVVSFADPTLLLSEGMSIGWGQADGKLFAPQQYAIILDVLREAKGLSGSNRTLHFGSSAGGFQALATAAFDKGSRVLCNNPQTDFSQYSVPWAANRALKINGFANREEFLASENIDEVAWRIDIPKLYEKLEYVPPHIRILINSASKNDLTVQAASFISGITEISSESTTNGYEMYFYYHPGLGHNPMPKAVTIHEIASQLDSFEA